MQAEYAATLNGSITQAVARARAVMRPTGNPVRINLLVRMVLRRRVHLNAAAMTALDFSSPEARPPFLAAGVEDAVAAAGGMGSGSVAGVSGATGACG